MIEISAALSGKFAQPDYVPASTNVNAPAGSDDIDPRRYSQFDRTASKVADADMSFGDFLDMVNPLQHIPVVSSIYRAVAGENINPVSRITGDILYGGAFGVGGALMGAAGSIANSMMEAKTGKDIAGTMIAGLFGDDAAPATDAGTALAAQDTTPTLAAVTQPAATQPVAVQAAVAQTTTPPAPQALAAAGDAQQGMPLTKSYPLVRGKQPYGGVIAPTANFHDENLKMAVAKALPGGVHVGDTVYGSRLQNGQLTLPPAPPAIKAPDATVAADTNPAANGPVISALPSTAANATPAVTPAATVSASAADNSLPPELQNDAVMLKALGLYRNVAESAR